MFPLEEGFGETWFPVRSFLPRSGHLLSGGGLVVVAGLIFLRLCLGF